MESAIAWVMPRGGSGPEFLRQRRRRRLVLDDGELLVTRRRRRGLRGHSASPDTPDSPDSPDDHESEVLARVPLRPGTLVADRNLITLRRLVLDHVDGPVTVEFGLGSRGFARDLAAAAR